MLLVVTLAGNFNTFLFYSRVCFIYLFQFSLD